MLIDTIIKTTACLLASLLKIFSIWKAEDICRMDHHLRTIGCLSNMTLIEDIKLTYMLSMPLRSKKIARISNSLCIYQTVRHSYKQVLSIEFTFKIV